MSRFVGGRPQDEIGRWSDMSTFVYDFSEGDKDQRDLLGGKGAGLAEMTNLGLPVPPGFTVTTDACRHYLAHGEEPPELAGQIEEHLDRVEERLGRRLGARLRPQRREVLDARDDGDRPRRRPRRRVRPGPRRPDR
jgi:hypothetical protein